MSVRLNTTRLRRYFRCEREWYAYAIEQVELRSRVDGPGLTRGKVMHALLEYALREYVRTGVVFDFAGDEGYHAAEHVYEYLYHAEGIALGEEDAHDLLASIRYHIPLLGLDRWEVLTVEVPDAERQGATKSVPAIELHLVAPLPGVDGIELETVIDVVFRHRVTGKIWLIDWKTTFNQIDTADMRPWLHNDYQFVIERWALALHGVTVDMTAKVHLRSQSLRPPELTPKTRKVTRNKTSLSCTWEQYKQALIDNFEDPTADDVQAVREHLESVTFARWRQDITSPVEDAHLREQITEAARRMLALANGERRPLLNLRDYESKQHKGCESCDYAKWCTAAMRTTTGDPDLSLLAVDYRPTSPASPFTGHQAAVPCAPYDASAAYVKFAAEHGQHVQPHQEFRP